MLWSEIMLMTTIGNSGRILRETPNFVASVAANGVRITTKDERVTPRSRTVASQTWEQLAPMSDADFDGSCVLDLGLGVFEAHAAANPQGGINQAGRATTSET